jgi:hypothetical protein
MSVSKFKEFITEATKGTTYHAEKMSDDPSLKKWVTDLQKAIKKNDWNGAKTASEVIDRFLNDWN